MEILLVFVLGRNAFCLTPQTDTRLTRLKALPSMQRHKSLLSVPCLLTALVSTNTFALKQIGLCVNLLHLRAFSGAFSQMTTMRRRLESEGDVPGKKGRKWETRTSLERRTRPTLTGAGQPHETAEGILIVCVSNANWCPPWQKQSACYKQAEGVLLDSRVLWDRERF